MKPTRIVIEHFMGIEFLDFKPADFQKICGGNGNGKSSVLAAVAWAFGGKTAAPEKIVRIGADEANVDIYVDDEFVISRRQPKEGAMTVKVKSLTEKGKKYGGVEGFLRDLFGDDLLAFDPMSFARAKPDEQFEMLMSVVPGFDCQTLDDEAESVFADRTNVNRDLKAAKAQLDAAVQPDVPADPGPDEDLAAIMAEHAAATEMNRKNAKMREEAGKIEADLEKSYKHRDESRRELEKAQFDCDALLDRLKKAKPHIERLKDADVEMIGGKMKLAQDANAKKATARQARQNAINEQNRYDELAQRVKQAEQVAASHTSRLDEIEREKKSMMEKTKFPVTGLSVAKKSVLYHGVPVGQCSTSERLRIGLAIAAARQTKLDLVLCDGAESFDNEQLAELERWGKEQELSALLTIVGTGIPGAIEIEAGRRKKPIAS